MVLKNIILDLDQTLISGEATEEFDFDKEGKRAKKYKYYDMDGYYIIFERPYLQEFLDFIFANFNVSIWTAASRDYCLFIVDNIILQKKPERKLDFIFFSYHCDISEKHHKKSKDLKTIWDTFRLVGYTKDNTVIIDDYDEVFNTQPDNCIAAPGFYFTDKKSIKDTFLHDLIPLLTDAKENGLLVRSINENFKKGKRKRKRPAPLDDNPSGSKSSDISPTLQPPPEEVVVESLPSAPN